MASNGTPTLTLTTDTDCVFYLEGVKQLQLIKGLAHELPLAPGHYTLNFVSIDNPDDSLLKEFEMPEQNAIYEVKFCGEVEANGKVKASVDVEASVDDKKEVATGSNSSRKRMWLVLGIVSIVLVIAFFVGYKPVDTLSVSVDNLLFDKWGEQHEVRIETNVKEKAVAFYPSGDGFDVEGNGYSCIVTATPNEGDVRKGDVKISAYTTLYGMRIGRGKSVSIGLSQESGLATNLDVSISSLSADKWGGNYQFVVKTDGVGLKVSSQNDWTDVQKESEDLYTVNVLKNPGDSRHGKIVVASGNLKKEIDVSQSSGLAHKLALNKSSIKDVSRDGGERYRVDVNTDGTTWDVVSNLSWVKIEKHDDYFEIEVKSNPDEVRDGYINVNSNNDHTASVHISQDGDPSFFYADYSNLTFGTSGGKNNISIHNDSRQPVSGYTISVWLDAYISGNKVRITCESNDDEPRDGTVELQCGSKKTSIKIHQKGWTTCDNCYGNGYISSTEWRQDSWYFMGQVMFGPAYLVEVKRDCPRCKNSGKRGKLKVD
ncbi:MAG: BACON domain-containing protein [Bacteroidales bacterium]|nr:BACON domain-containing protein [Bacteroidales bacterium]